jgi:glucose/mannose-6-phosphate isomerase
MLEDVLAQPQQVEDALWRVDSAGVPRADLAGGLLVAGMGGSAVGGDLAAAAIGERARTPIRTVRGFALEPWTSPDTLVLCASYSGQTEETLAAFEAAGELGASRVALTTGGALAEAARAAGVPVIGIPAGMQPRAAVVYMTVAALECAAACGAVESLRGELEAAPATLGALTEEWGPEQDDSLPWHLAALLASAVPVLYGAGSTAAPAHRWATQLNENAEIPAFASELPEADHNEIVGYGAGVAPLAVVFLDDDRLDERLRKRIDVTAELLGGTGVPVERVEARGRSAVERVLSLVLLGDLVSVYVALGRGVDPTPVEPIDELKRRLR